MKTHGNPVSKKKKTHGNLTKIMTDIWIKNKQVFKIKRKLNMPMALVQEILYSVSPKTTIMLFNGYSITFSKHIRAT